jgi:hypothetical protein
MATGSYEGPLPMEGIPDHHEVTVFTGRHQRWSRRFPASSDPYQPVQKTDVRPRLQLPRKRARREGENLGESRQGCQRLGRHQRRGKKTPTLVSPGREAIELEIRVA